MSSSRRNGFRLVIFDWDGTILDSVAAIVECTRVTMAELGLEPAPEETIRSLIGLGIRETVDTLHPGCDEELFQRMLSTYRHHWLGGYNARPAPFAGIAGALAELRGAGYLLAVATAKGREGLEMDLAASGLGPCFATTRTVTEAPSKPHPGMLLGILDELEVDAADALMVGDTTHDLRMAANAGIAALAVSSGSQGRAELMALAPLACLASAAELPAWLVERQRGGAGREAAGG